MINIRSLAGVLVLVAASSTLAAEPAKAAAARKVEISVTENGFEPTPIKVKKGEALTLVVTRKTEATCAKKLVLDEGNISVELPMDKAVEIPFTPKKAGQVKYGCQMGKMIAGVLLVE